MVETHTAAVERKPFVTVELPAVTAVAIRRVIPETIVTVITNVGLHKVGGYLDFIAYLQAAHLQIYTMCIAVAVNVLLFVR